MVFRHGGPLASGRSGYYDQHRHWHDVTPLLDDSERVMPETVPHSWVGQHEAACGCEPCRRYPADALRRAKAASRRSG